MLAAALILASAGLLQAAETAATSTQPTPALASTGASLPRGTSVQLMVLTEVNSRTAKPGDRFKLRVHAPVLVDGQLVVPVGATAWGEVMSASGTGIAGGRGRLTVRLVELETSSRPIRLSGTVGREGRGNTAGVAIAVLSFGLGGLLNKGGNASVKAGDIVTAQVDESAAGPPLVATP